VDKHRYYELKLRVQDNEPLNSGGLQKVIRACTRRDPIFRVIRRAAAAKLNPNQVRERRSWSKRR